MQRRKEQFPPAAYEEQVMRAPDGCRYYRWMGEWWVDYNDHQLDGPGGTSYTSELLRQHVGRRLLQRLKYPTEGKVEQKLWDASYMGWHMIVEAGTGKEALAIASRSVESFGGVVGVDRPHVRLATQEDVDEWKAMAGQ